MGASIEIAIMAWLLVGVAITVLFLATGGRGLVTRGSSVAFRIWILPSCAALWPVVVVQWMRRPSGSSVE